MKNEDISKYHNLYSSWLIISLKICCLDQSSNSLLSVCEKEIILFWMILVILNHNIFGVEFAIDLNLHVFTEEKMK